MRKNIAMICVTLAAVIAVQGCINHEIRVDSFEDLCIASGGETYAKGSNQCMCGFENDKTLCASGVVCSNSGRTCASTSLIGTICSDSDDEIVDYQICENIGNTGYNLACLKDSNDGKYRWTEQDVCKPSENINANRADNDENVSCTIDSERKSICGECLNGEYGCLKSEKMDVYKVVQCIDGKWADEVVENVCRNMINSSERSIGVKLGCTSEGVLKTEMECTKNNKVVSCHHNDCGICLNGHWEYVTACDSGNCMDVDEEIATAKCTECKPGTGKCENDIIYRCDDNGMWVLEDDCSKKFKSCNPNTNYESEIPVCGECQHGEVNCTDSDDKGAKKICQYGEWSESIPCEDKNNIQKSCSSNTSCGECKNDDTKCKENMHFICINGNWIMDKVCEFGCSDDNQVASCNECSIGTIKCENDDNGIAKYSVCENGTWTEKTDICIAQDTTDPEADGLKYSCAFNGVLECVKDETGNCKIYESDKYEFDVECGQCINNEYECGDKGEIKVCENGKMVTKHESVVCIDGENGGSEQWCNVDNKQNARRECKDNENKPASCKGNHCGDCLNGTLQCNSDGSRLDVCRNGVWEFAKICESGICQDKKCLECSGGKTKCENGVVYTCNESGLWGSAENCIATEDGKYGIKEGDFVSCNLSNECGECNDGTFCFNDTNNSGYRVTCKNGMWGSETVCNNNYSCKSESNCGECVNGDTECKNGKIRTCMNGQWDEYIDCPNGADCKSDAKTCGECNNTEKNICRDSKILLTSCVYGVWEQKSCSENQYCHVKEGDDKCELNQCTGSETKCKDYESGGKKLNCEDKHWSETPCEIGNEAVSCGSETECGDCLNGTIRYDEIEGDVCVEYTCINGKEKSYINSNGFSCKFEGSGFIGVGICNNNGAPKIVNNSDDICETLTCVNGDWGDPIVNSEGYSCSKDSEGNLVNNGKCKNGTSKFEEDSNGVCVKSNCSDGQWVIDDKVNMDGFSCKVLDGKNIDIGECFNGKVYKENELKKCVEYQCVGGVLLSPEIHNVSCKTIDDKVLKGDCLNDMYQYASSMDGDLGKNNVCNIQPGKYCMAGIWTDSPAKRCDNGCFKIDEVHVECR